MKRFLEWIGIKEKTHSNEILPVFQEREIWWVHLGENVGHEEDGKGDSFTRPFVVIRKFNRELLFGVPCSSVNKKSIYYFDIFIKTKNMNTSAFLSQARTISSRRLVRRIDKMGSGVFVELKKALQKALFE
jgi:mRNA interferase MazF